MKFCEYHLDGNWSLPTADDWPAPSAADNFAAEAERAMEEWLEKAHAEAMRYYFTRPLRPLITTPIQHAPSYWSQPYPREREVPWTGEERVELRYDDGGGK